MYNTNTQGKEIYLIPQYLSEVYLHGILLLGLRKTSRHPGSSSSGPEAVLYDRGVPIGTPRPEKQVINTGGESGVAGILLKSSLSVLGQFTTHFVDYWYLFKLKLTRDGGIGARSVGNSRLSQDAPVPPYLLSSVLNLGGKHA